MHGPCTRPVHTTRVHDCIRAVSTYVFGRVHGAYTAPYTGRVHGHVRAVHTAVYTTRIRPRTRVYVYGPSTRLKNGRLHGRTGPCNVSCILPCTGRIGSCTRHCTGRVHDRFRPCTLAVYTAVFGRLHSAYRAVWAVYTAGRPTRPCTRSQTARYGHVRPVTAYGPCTRPSTRPVHVRVHGP